MASRKNKVSSGNNIQESQQNSTTGSWGSTMTLPRNGDSSTNNSSVSIFSKTNR